MKLTSDVKQRNKEVNIIDPNPNNSFERKKKFTGSNAEVNPKKAYLQDKTIINPKAYPYQQ